MPQLEETVREGREGILLAVRVVPRASRTALAGVYDDSAEARLKVSLAAPPVDGKANQVLTDYIAEILSVPRAAVTLVAGAQSRNKRVSVAGRSVAQVIEGLRAALPGKPA